MERKQFFVSFVSRITHEPNRRDQSHTQDILQDIQSVRYTFVLDRWATLFLLKASSTRIGQNSEALLSKPLPLQRRQKGDFPPADFPQPLCHAATVTAVADADADAAASASANGMRFPTFLFVSQDIGCEDTKLPACLPSGLPDCHRSHPSVLSFMKYSRMARSPSRKLLSVLDRVFVSLFRPCPCHASPSSARSPSCLVSLLQAPLTGSWVFVVSAGHSQHSAESCEEAEFRKRQTHLKLKMRNFLSPSLNRRRVFWKYIIIA